MNGVAVSLVPGIVGVLRLFGLAVSRKMDFGRVVVWLVDASFVETTGTTPVADARGVRLLGAVKREIRDALGLVTGLINETRESDAE